MRPCDMTGMFRISHSFGILLFLAAFVSGSPSQADIHGKLFVIDGDTVDLGGQRIRLHGIDAPEQDQTCEAGGSGSWACGAWATDQLRNMAEGRLARCVELDQDRYGRIVARCQVSGQDIGAWMVERGMAIAYVRYSQDYVAHESRARRDRG